MRTIFIVDAKAFPEEHEVFSNNINHTRIGANMTAAREPHPDQVSLTVYGRVPRLPEPLKGKAKNVISVTIRNDDVQNADALWQHIDKYAKTENAYGSVGHDCFQGVRKITIFVTGKNLNAANSLYAAIVDATADMKS